MSFFDFVGLFVCWFWLVVSFVLLPIDAVVTIDDSNCDISVTSPDSNIQNTKTRKTKTN